MPDGSIMTVGGSNAADNYVLNPEITSDDADTWDLLPTMLGSSGSSGGYPRLHVAPDGRLFVAGQQASTQFLSADLSTWTVGPYAHSKHSYGGSVEYDDGKILNVGGTGISGAAVAVAETTDLNQPTPSWTLTGPLNTARQWGNTTILPDGTVLVNGGADTPTPVFDCAYAVLSSELWSPVTGQWTVMASEAHPRIEHSTSILLPDGRVLSSGGTQINSSLGGTCGPYLDAQLYSPPYLFKGPRPTITGAPSTVTYGQQFLVATPNTDITSVSWIALSAVTHVDNQGQHLTHPAFTAATGGLQVTAPLNANLAPPGFYMMFLINSAGVPSYAKFVQIS
jgi:hypothetical protein